MSSSRLRSCVCEQQFSLLDGHELCPTCRKCSRSKPCDICVTWTQDDWAKFLPSPDGTSSVSSEARPSPSRRSPPILSRSDGLSGDEISPNGNAIPPNTTEKLANPPQVSEVRPKPVDTLFFAGTGEFSQFHPPPVTSATILAPSGATTCSNVSSTPVELARTALGPGSINSNQLIQGPPLQRGYTTPYVSTLTGTQFDRPNVNCTAAAMVSGRNSTSSTDQQTFSQLSGAGLPGFYPSTADAHSSVAIGQLNLSQLSSIIGNVLESKIPRWSAPPGNFPQTYSFSHQGNFPQAVQPGFNQPQPVWADQGTVIPERQTPYQRSEQSNVTRSGVSPTVPYTDAVPDSARHCSTTVSSAPSHAVASRKAASGNKGGGRVKRTHPPSATVSQPGARTDNAARTTQPVRSKETKLPNLALSVTR